MLYSISHIESFVPTVVDIYTGVTRPPPPLNIRAEDVPCLICGAFQQGTETRQSAALNFTHIMLFDPTVELRDGYDGSGTITAANQDLLNIPGTDVSYAVRFVYVAVIPKIGKKKVVIADRFTVATNWNNVL